jgi:asparagine synthase (glutamine-hydrolysing)
MCGIAGIIASKNPEGSYHTLAEMLNRIRSRGPDNTGIWQENNVFLGHVRLSILDLSAAGHQPMISGSGRYVMSYNGEIYNQDDIKRLLPKDLIFKGHSDTETILHAIDHLGLQKTVRLMVGMFALAVYDRKTRKLSLVRDPIGIKPLYYGYVDKDLVFSSQIKAFTSHPLFKKDICPIAQGLYFKYNYVPTPYAIYKNCYKQKPGTILTFEEGRLVDEDVYWRLSDAYLRGMAAPFPTFEEACAFLERVLDTAIKRQLMADVPVGVFLSGGIDSSLIAALASKNGEKIQTFSIGFEEGQYNEAHHAKKVAEYLGTIHTEEYLPTEKAIPMLGHVPEYCDEPLGDASQIPTLLVSQLAKKHVSVVLSGDGGDELFYGYSRYKDLQKIRILQKFLPRSVQPCIQKLVSLLYKTPGVNNGKAFKLYMAQRALLSKDIEKQYDDLFDFWPEFIRDDPLPRLAPPKLPGMGDEEYMSYHDAHLYLPDNILTKVDRCSMHLSLESRVPFLDHPVVEATCRIPFSFKCQKYELKSVLKNILSRYVPKSLTDRPKQGFALPIDLWIRNPLKDWAMSLLDDFKKEGHPNVQVVEKRMAEHMTGKVNWQYSLWNILMWQQWKNYYKAEK